MFPLLHETLAEPAQSLPGGERPRAEACRRGANACTRHTSHAPKLPAQGKRLLNGLLERDPERRLSAHQAQQHPWFQEQLGWEAEAPRIAADLPRLIAQVRFHAHAG